MKKYCAVCSKPLVKKDYESEVQFKTRTHCDRSCAAKTLRDRYRHKPVSIPILKGDAGRLLTREEIDELVAQGAIHA